MRGQTASKTVLDSILIKENLNFKVLLTGITLASGETLGNIGNSKILAGGFKYEDAIGDDNEFNIIGTAIARSLTIKLYNENNMYSDYEFEGMSCTVNVSQSIPEEYLYFGDFNVVDAVYSENSITLTMLDNLSKLDVPYVDTVGQYPVTLSTMLSRIRSITNVEILTLNLDDDRKFILNHYKVYNAPDSETVSCRDVLGWIAGIIGCFATTNVYYSTNYHGYFTHAITFRWPGSAMLETGTFSEPDFYVIDENGEAHVDPRLVTSEGGEETAEVTGAEVSVSAPTLLSFYNENIAVSDVVITGVKVIINDLEDSNVYEYLYGTEDYCITIKENQLITNATAQDVADFIGGTILGLTFRKCTVSHVGNILLEAGDFVYVRDSKGNEHKILITRTTIDIGSAQTIVCGCEDVASNGRKISSQTTKAYSAAKQKISKMREELDTLANELDQQYFWHDESGQHAGSHITQQKRADFVEDPENGGYNAHFTNTALKLRDGLTTLSEFANDHVQLGQGNEVHTYIASNSNTIYDPAGTRIFHMLSSTDSDGNTWINYVGTITVPMREYNNYYRTSTIAFSSISPTYADLFVEIGSCTGTWNEHEYSFEVYSIDYTNKTFRVRTYDDASADIGSVSFYIRIRILTHRTTFMSRIGTFDDPNSWGTNSHAIGSNNKAGLGASFAIGVGIDVENEGNVAVGKYNTVASDYRFAVGNGTDDSNRETAFAIGTNSNAYLHIDQNAAETSIDGYINTDLERLSLTSYIVDTTHGSMLNLKRAFHILLSRVYRLRNFLDKSIANNLTTTSAGTAVLDAKQGWELKRYINEHGVIHEYNWDGNSAEDWSRLTVYGDGKIEYQRVEQIELTFQNQIGTTGWYTSTISRSCNFPSSIHHAGQYMLAIRPIVHVDICKSVAESSYSDVYFRVNGCKKRDDGSGRPWTTCTDWYSFAATAQITATVQIAWHIIGRGNWFTPGSWTADT